jgi:hypothetical protein
MTNESEDPLLWEITEPHLLRWNEMLELFQFRLIRSCQYFGQSDQILAPIDDLATGGL